MEHSHEHHGSDKPLLLAILAVLLLYVLALAIGLPQKGTARWWPLPPTTAAAGEGHDDQPGLDEKHPADAEKTEHGQEHPRPKPRSRIVTSTPLTDTPSAC